MLEKVLDLKKKSMFLTDTLEDIDAHFRYIASKKKNPCFFRSGHPYFQVHNSFERSALTEQGITLAWLVTQETPFLSYMYIISLGTKLVIVDTLIYISPEFGCIRAVRSGVANCTHSIVKYIKTKYNFPEHSSGNLCWGIETCLLKSYNTVTVIFNFFAFN